MIYGCNNAQPQNAQGRQSDCDGHCVTETQELFTPDIVAYSSERRIWVENSLEVLSEILRAY